MFLKKEKYAKLFKKTKELVTNIVNQNKLNVIFKFNINKQYSTFYNNQLYYNKKNTNALVIKNQKYLLSKTFQRNYSILEKIREKDEISKEDFKVFLTQYQNAEISLSDFPLRYKKFIREIKLMPKEPEEPDDCCGKDCVPCNIEFYHEKLDRRDEMIDDLFKKIYPDSDKENSSDFKKSKA